MGQTIGRAPLAAPEIAWLANLPKRCIFGLWEAFNDVAEGLGLTLEEFRDVLIAAVKEHLGVTQKRLDEIANAVFAVLDDDDNGLIDALETLASLSVLSGMPAEEKMRYVFRIYDFDESGMLSGDETILAIRSAVGGLCKIAGIAMPLETEVDAVVREALLPPPYLGTAAGRANHRSVAPGDQDALSCEDFVERCSRCPEVVSWLAYFAEIRTADSPAAKANPAGVHGVGGTTSAGTAATATAAAAAAVAAVIERDTVVAAERTDLHMAAMDIDGGHAARLAVDARCTEEDTRPRLPWQNALPFLEPAASARGLSTSAPATTATLEWAYGFSATCGRGSVAYAASGLAAAAGGTGEIIYPSGAVVILHDPDAHSQRFFSGHTDTVQCAAVHRFRAGDPALIFCGSMVGGSGSGGGSVVLVATGQLGVRPKVVVWRADTAAAVATFRSVHRRGVSHASFSPDGLLLLTIGMEEEAQSIAVHHWAYRSTIFTATAGAGSSEAAVARQPILGCHFAAASGFVTCGVDHITFWSQAEFCAGGGGGGGGDAAYRPEPGLLGRLGPVGTQCCCTKVGAHVISGAANGYIYQWEGRNCIRRIKAHGGAVTAIAVPTSATGRSGGSFMTGGSDGKVHIWNHRLEAGATFDLRALGGLGQDVHSLCWDARRRRALVALASGEAFEINDRDGATVGGRGGRPTVAGHGTGGVQGVATHPRRPDTFCTVGADRTVRLWDRRERRLVRMCTLDTLAGCCAYDPDATVIAVGFGGPIDGYRGYCSSFGASSSGGNNAGRRPRKEGGFLILRESDLTVVHEGRDSKRAIAAVAWSSDGATLAVASRDGCVYLYNGGDYVAKAKCGGFLGGVSHIDFSADGKLLQADSVTAGELLFFDVERGDREAPSGVRDVPWETQTCILGWPVAGAWPALADGAAPTHAARSHGGEQLLVADNFGRLRLFRYPCVTAEHAGHLLSAHGAPVAAAAFTADDGAAVSVGGIDGSVMLWRMDGCNSGTTASSGRASASVAGSITADSGGRGRGSSGSLAGGDRGNIIRSHRSGEDDTGACGRLCRTSVVDAAKNDSSQAVMRMEETGAPEHFAPLRPWHRTVPAPADAPLGPPDLREPASELCLEWVHGFRARDGRGSVLCAADGRLVFPAGAVAVAFDASANIQRFFLDHSDEVTALALHPTRPLAASAQAGRVPAVKVWSLATMAALVSLHGRHRHGISHVAFSPDGRLLLTVGDDARHALTVYDWEDQAVVAAADGGGQHVLDAGFAPDGRSVVLCRDGSVTFWSLQGRALVPKPAVFPQRGSVGGVSVPAAAASQAFMCLGWDNAPFSALTLATIAVVGAADGCLYRFIGRQLDRVVPAHKGEVLTMSTAVTTAGAGAGAAAVGLATGGRDGVVRLWGPGLTPRLSINVALLGPTRAAVRSVCWDAPRGRVVVGTASAEVFELSAATGESLRPGNRPALQGHGARALWGLACSPATPQFCTVGEDCMLRIWDLNARRAARQRELEMPARAVCYAPDGGRIAVGYGMPFKEMAKQFDGKWAVFKSDDLTPLHEARDAQKHVTDMCWSSDGLRLAVAAADCKIYIYECEKDYVLSALVTAHGSPVTGMDFSADGRYMRSTSGGSGELLVFEADTGMVIPAASRLRNVSWATHHTVFNWAAQGAWPAQADGTEVLAAAVTLP
ncbi:unnamed protein product, partial [Phaeothamnion confervicola]